MMSSSVVGAFIAVVAGVAAMAVAAEPKVMPLWPDIPPSVATMPASAATTAPAETVTGRGDGKHPNRMVRGVVYPELTVYLPDADKNTGTVVVICPGGGYAGLAIDKEGHDVARWLNTLGVAGVVLKYRMPHGEAATGATPLPLKDARRAIRVVRAHAEEWKIRPDRVGLIGFSAGGHLASTAATHTLPANPDAADALEKFSTRPDFLILGYPVISMHDPVAHKGSRNNLLGASPDPKYLEEYSSDLKVTKDTPPTFLVHAKDDQVKVENSVQFYQALQKAGVPAEFDELNKGGHGFGLGTGRGEEAEAWPAKCAEWLKKQGLLNRD